MTRVKQDLPLSESNHRSNSPHMIRRALPVGRKLKVGIVGAGVSGLRAADCLLKQNVDVTILEARSRIGGRVGQRDLGGHLVDLGPNWIHGTNNNPILTLAQKTNTEVYLQDEQLSLFDVDSNPIREEDAAEALEGFWSIVADAFKYSNEHCERIPSSESLGDFVRKKAKERYSDLPPAEAKEKQRMLENESLTWGPFVGGETKRQSLKYFWLEEVIEGENPYVAGTYRKILKEIAGSASAGATIRLDTEVVTIGSEKAQDQVTVTTKNGQTETFDEVIVTCSLGFLKHNKQVFEPPLPGHLSKAIDAIGYGQLDKVYIRFPTAFWDRLPNDSTASKPHASTNGSTTSNTSSANLAPNTTSTFSRDETASEEDKSMTHKLRFAHYHPPDYAPDTNPDSLNQQCMNMAILPGSTSHPTLCFYISGPGARHISKISPTGSNHLSASESSDQLTEATHPEFKPLVDFFKPYYSLLPNFDPNDPDCKPSYILSTNWCADRFSGYGSYSNFQIGLEDADTHIETMRYGMPERRVWIAGEAVAPFVALGTVTGAYWAGEGVAGKIMECYSDSHEFKTNGAVNGSNGNLSV